MKDACANLSIFEIETLRSQKVTTVIQKMQAGTRSRGGGPGGADPGRRTRGDGPGGAEPVEESELGIIIYRVLMFRV